MGDGLAYWLLRSSDMVLSKPSAHLRQPVADYFRTTIRPDCKRLLHAATIALRDQNVSARIRPMLFGRLPLRLETLLDANFISEIQLSKDDLARLTHRNA